jgi:hypothetical protein
MKNEELNNVKMDEMHIIEKEFHKYLNYYFIRIYLWKTAIIKTIRN